MASAMPSCDCSDCRGSAFPLALKGDLKLKEISYIHAEGYAAGEMKHGPIALSDETVPVVVLAPKMISDAAGVARLEGRLAFGIAVPR